MHNSDLRKQGGVGLIEVLVTLLILSTSLIALTALQTRSLQFNHGAYLRSQMNIYAYDILERIRMRPENLASRYSTPVAAFNKSASAPTGNQPALDIYEWRKNIDSNFPDGKAGIECDDIKSTCKIIIQWTEVNTMNQDISTLEERDKMAKFEYTARL